MRTVKLLVKVNISKRLFPNCIKVLAVNRVCGQNKTKGKMIPLLSYERIPNCLLWRSGSVS